MLDYYVLKDEAKKMLNTLISYNCRPIKIDVAKLCKYYLSQKLLCVSNG